ncbi:hypothetical protein A2U01_0057296, partial [Trifolium medium]|nr:hypothetical protein [Trifolium medium]
MGGGAE